MRSPFGGFAGVAHERLRSQQLGQRGGNCVVAVRTVCPLDQLLGARLVVLKETARCRASHAGAVSSRCSRRWFRLARRRRYLARKTARTDRHIKLPIRANCVHNDRACPSDPEGRWEARSRARRRVRTSPLGGLQSQFSMWIMVAPPIRCRPPR